jgi:hypothetical protein
LDTPSPEVGGKAAVCTTILSGGVVSYALRGSSGFPFGGGFNAMMESGFCPCIISFYFWLLSLEKQAGSPASKTSGL